MVAVKNIRRLGRLLQVTYSDGTTQSFVPSETYYVPSTKGPGVAQGAGGENDDPGTGGTPGSVGAAVDDYPWPNAPEDDYSPLRYSYRDCTDFVAWRINRDDGCTHSPWLHTWADLRYQNGNAIGWRPDWIHYGRGYDLSAAAGRIGWYGSKAGTYGHVNYVQKVNTDGSIVVEEYNWGGTQAYNTRTVSPGSAYYPDSFLAIP